MPGKAVRIRSFPLICTTQTQHNTGNRHERQERGMLACSGGVLAANVRHFGSNLLKCSRLPGADL